MWYDYVSYVPLLYLGVMLVHWHIPSCRRLFIAIMIMILCIELFKVVSSDWIDKAPFLKRPDGAVDCGCWNHGGPMGHKPGFPSGHVAATTFIVLSLLMLHGSWSWLWMAYAVLVVVLVALARVEKMCHTWMQVISGGLVGGVYFLFFLFSSR